MSKKIDSMISEVMAEFGKRRWKGISKRKRSSLVPHTGGRKRQYPQCPRYPAHRFVNDRCPCGYIRKVTR